jgi:hypothetical protein
VSSDERILEGKILLKDGSVAFKLRTVKDGTVYKVDSVEVGAE